MYLNFDVAITIGKGGADQALCQMLISCKERSVEVRAEHIAVNHAFGLVFAIVSLSLDDFPQWFFPFT